ncbi:serine/threonine-protein kinase Sgk2 [Xylaria cubensis]|nr:serine/threonine-protein kinase Sgk2 [Xylaria cubensis]
MTLTEEQTKIISQHPLELDSLRNKLPDNVNNLQAKDVIVLLRALDFSPAARSLPSNQHDNIAHALFSIELRIETGQVKFDHFRSVVNYVISNFADAIIWEEILAVIDNLGRTTPPQSNNISPTISETPSRGSSSRLSYTELCHMIEKELFEEIKTCTFRNVGGFWDKFFEPKSRREEQRAMLKAVMTAYNGNRWTDFPDTTDEALVWSWLCSLKTRFLTGTSHILHHRVTPYEFKEQKGQMDLFLQKQTAGLERDFLYKDVLVIGKQRKSCIPDEFKDDILQLTRYVRNVFAEQPTRRFVHAFLLCASEMELWVFDRSGAYSSGLFSIHQEPDKFARAFIGYATMDDDAMGLDIFMKQENGWHSIALTNANNEEEVDVKLYNHWMVRQTAVVSRGTTCYETQDNNVAKFSWVSDKRVPEFQQLVAAEKRGVEGVARVVAYRQLTSIQELRKGLKFSEPHPFGENAKYRRNEFTPNSTSCKKRKLASDHASDQASASKRARVYSKSKLSQEFEYQPSLNKCAPSLHRSNDEAWDNRIYSCLVVSPAGRVISNFQTTKELLESMRDAIRAHQSLFTTGNILHRDISSNNIIITDPKKANGFKGMLIDLDMAVTDTNRSGAQHRIGTTRFMAIEVLRKCDHTYRHDLESFFYVLIWMCAHQSWRNGFGAKKEVEPESSLLRTWEVGTYEEIALSKSGDMTGNVSHWIFEEFPRALDAIKPLCFKIRDILFPVTSSRNRDCYGTPRGHPDRLYKPILDAYDATIKSL